MSISISFAVFSDLRRKLKMIPASYRLHPAERAKLKFLCERIGKDESELVREGLAGLFQKYAPILEARFTPEAILAAATENIDTCTLSEIYPELRALPWEEFQSTRQKFETIFADKVIEIMREEFAQGKFSAGGIEGNFSVEWHQTPRQAADAILSTLKCAAT